MALKRLALTSQNYTEDDRGLVSASLQFVAKASDRSAVDAMFYTDAPPPIWPTYLDRGRLIGRNLFMQSRTLTEQYGLLTIDALFVGGRERIIPVVTSDFESPVTSINRSEPFSLTYRRNENSTATYGNLISELSYTYTPRVNNLSFVRVGSIDSFSPVKPQAEDMFELVSFFSYAPTLGQNGELISNTSSRQFFIDILKSVPVIEDRKTEALTPTVKIVSVRYSFGS